MSSRNQKDRAGTKLRKPHHRHQPQPSFLIVLLLEKLHQGASRQDFSAKSLRSSSIISLNSFPPRFMFIFFLFVLYFLFCLITYEIVNYGTLVFLLFFAFLFYLFIIIYFSWEMHSRLMNFAGSCNVLVGLPLSELCSI